MPTENRSSNTEQMVSVLEKIDDIAERFEIEGLHSHPTYKQFKRLFAELKATQHQGEPVFMVRSHGSCCWEESNGEGLDIALSMPDEYEVRKLYLHPPTSDGFSAGDMADQGAKAFAARDPEVEELRELLRAMTCGYRVAVQAGHARITALGGDCDSVDRMLADFPEYAKAIAATKRKS